MGSIYIVSNIESVFYVRKGAVRVIYLLLKVSRCVVVSVKYIECPVRWEGCGSVIYLVYGGRCHLEA